MSNFTVTHNDIDITTIEDFLNGRSVSLVKNMTAREFLLYNGDGILSNFSRIQQKLPNATERNDNQQLFDSGSYGSVKINIGTKLLIPIEKTSREILYKFNENVVQTTTSKAFLASQLGNLLRDPKYSQTINIGKKGVTTINNSDITVYAWIRSLSSDNDAECKGSWFDVTPFVESVSTNVSKDGGDFSINLSPVLAKEDKDKGWVIDPKSIDNYNEKVIKQNFVAQSSIHDEEGNRSKYFFHNTIQENDLFYIRFEKLQIEEKNKEESGGVLDDEIISEKTIPNNIYDMIGLVDTNNIVFSSEKNDINISIQGRDLMKIFIEDGSYFFPEQFAGRIFADNESGLMNNRGKLDGAILSLSAYLERSILFTLQFVISQLSTTGLVPDDIFKGYDKKKLSTKYIFQGSKEQPEVKNTPMEGIWSIIRLLVDPSVSKRRVVDASIATEQGSMINSINKICQDPFVEFFGDTYGDIYVFQARKPPFDKKSVEGFIYEDIEEEDANSINQPENELSEEDTNGAVVLDEVSIEEEKLSAIVLDIYEDQILDEQLYYDDEAYSWYRLVPSAMLFGDGNTMTLAYIPAISFDQYAKVWGSRVYAKETNYIEYQALQDEKSEEKDDTLIKQAVEDLKYMIECNACLPFTRKGTIVVHGNRTYKRGTFVRHFSTNELFYIDNVQNDWEINSDVVDRTTTLTVSRGMKIPYIKGVLVDFEGSEKLVSYFTIADTTIPEGAVVDSEFLKNWKVDDDIFSFFIKRRQCKEVIEDQ